MLPVGARMMRRLPSTLFQSGPVQCSNCQMLQLHPTACSLQRLATADQLTHSDASSEQGVVEAGVDAPMAGRV